MVKMNPCNVIAAVVLFLSTASAFNITRILEQYPEYSQFNDLLTKTDLAAAVNQRRTITVLAVSNDAIGEVTSKPEDVQKRILSTHVVLDYYDGMKLNNLKGNDTVLTTLLQTTGTAQGRQGFLKVAHLSDGGVAFGSAVRESPVDAKFEGSVFSRPYNISVLRISHPIIVNGIDGNWTALPPEEAPVPAPPPPPEEAPASSPEEAVVDAPAPAEGPAADAPAPSPADAPAADDPSADADTPAADESSGTVKRVASGVAVAVSLLAALF